MAKKKVTITTQPAGPARDLDQWVKNQQPTTAEPMKRLTIDVPESLHTRIKAQCALRRLRMADEIRRLLELNFPEG